MAKLVAGVKSFKSIMLVTAPVTVTQYRLSNGRVMQDKNKANRAQTRLNTRAASANIRDFLDNAGISFPSCKSAASVERLAAALLNPKFVRNLIAVANAG